MTGRDLYRRYVRAMAPATTDDFDEWEDLNPVHARCWDDLAAELLGDPGPTATGATYAVRNLSREGLIVPFDELAEMGNYLAEYRNESCIEFAVEDGVARGLSVGERTLLAAEIERAS